MTRAPRNDRIDVAVENLVRIVADRLLTVGVADLPRKLIRDDIRAWAQRARKKGAIR